MKKVIWHPKARKVIRSFPKEIKSKFGYRILSLQRGDHLTMPQSRPMPSVAQGVSELRVKGEDGIYRAFYLLKIADSIVIFHAFKKETQKTPQNEIDLGKKYLKELINA